MNEARELLREAADRLPGYRSYIYGEGHEAWGLTASERRFYKRLYRFLNTCDGEPAPCTAEAGESPGALQGSRHASNTSGVA